jgi:predicted porin
MKKSLVALAVLAASGAAMAQVSITGNLTAGFRSSDKPIGSLGDRAVPSTVDQSSSGLGVDTAEIVFTATEDLGGGMKASAKLGLVDAARGLNRGNGVNTGFGPGDTELSLSGGFGKLSLSTSRGADYLSGGVAGVGGTFMDGRVFSARTSTDTVAFSAPMGPVSVGLSYSEKADSLGLGKGSSGPASETAARQVVLDVNYADGPLAAHFAYLADADVDAKNHYRLAGSYDLGVAKLGAGFERQSYGDATGGTKQTWSDMLVAVSVPLGATTLSANWAQREISDRTVAADNGKYDGYGLKASYALSKRTAVSVDYTNWAGFVNAKKQSEYNVFLSHSF